MKIITPLHPLSWKQFGKSIPFFLMLGLNFIFADLHAQHISIWKGMTPGHENQWNYPANWSRNAVPDEFTDVIIPHDHTGGKNYPLIVDLETTINSLCIWSGAYLTLKRGEVITIDKGKNYYKPTQILVTEKVNLHIHRGVRDLLSGSQ